MTLPSLALILALSLGAYAPQQVGSEPLSPALEARVQVLGKQLRCAVCQGLSITDSPASMARAQLDKVRALVTEGKSDTEVREYFVARYGEWVLLSPPKHGFNWLVWLGPGALILVGLALVLKTLKTRPSGPAPPHAGASAPGAPLKDPYVDAIRAELDS